MFSLKIPEYTLNCQKTVFESNYKTMMIVQAQVEKIAVDLWGKSSPTGTMDHFKRTLSEYKKIHKDLKKIVDENFSKCEALLKS